MYDATARRAAKGGGGVFPLDAAAARPGAGLRRLDARTAPPPPETELTCDALVFAELAYVWGEWKKALEGWNVRVSQQILEWQAEAVVKTRQKVLLRLLEKRCKAPVPSDLNEVIQATLDMSLLQRWFDAAAETATFDEFRAAMQARD